MSDEQIAVAFNEWMHRYTEHPEAYEASFRTIGEFLQQQNDGAEPTYGQVCAAYLAELHAEIESAAAGVPFSG